MIYKKIGLFYYKFMFNYSNMNYLNEILKLKNGWTKIGNHNNDINKFLINL